MALVSDAIVKTLEFTWYSSLLCKEKGKKCWEADKKKTFSPVCQKWYIRSWNKYCFVLLLLNIHLLKHSSSYWKELFWEWRYVDGCSPAFVGLGALAPFSAVCVGMVPIKPFCLL